MSPRTLKALQRDAARYRFLRKLMTSDTSVGVWSEKDGRPQSNGWLVYGECDRTVDAAIRKVAKT